MSHAAIILEEPAVAGDSVRFLAHVRNYAGNLTDPSSAGFVVYTEQEEVVANVEAIRDSIGQYHGDWQIPVGQAKGWYWLEFFGVMSGVDTHRRRAKFQIVFG